MKHYSFHTIIFFPIDYLIHLLSYDLANKRSLHVRSQGLEIPTLIGENKKIKITHHCHNEKNQPKIPIYIFINYPPMPLKYISIYKYKSIHRFAYQATYCAYLQDISYTNNSHVLPHIYLIILPKSQIHLHDYIIISQNQQDNSRLCTILDYHLVCSDHNEKVIKVGPAMRITKLEAKSKGMYRAASFFILHRVWRLSITYYLLVMSERAYPQTQCKHKATHCTSNLTFFAILLHPYPC